MQVCFLGLNDSMPCRLGTFCSSEADVGELFIMVEAEVGISRPVTYIDRAESSWAANCEPGQGAQCKCANPPLTRAPSPVSISLSLQVFACA